MVRKFCLSNKKCKRHSKNKTNTSINNAGSGPPFKGHAETRAVAGPSFISQQEHETVDVLKPVEIGNEPVISTTTSDPFTPQAGQTSTSVDPSGPLMHRNKRRMIENGVTRRSKRLQITNEINKDQNPLMLSIMQRRAAERLASQYCYARFKHGDDHHTALIDLGNMNYYCKFCAAKLFQFEISNQTSQICCHKGKISLENIEVPPILQDLITKNDKRSLNFLDNIRKYNNALAFASVKVNSIPICSRGPYCFKIHGQVYHQVGSLNVPEGQVPSYSSLFIIESSEALKLRMDHSANAQCSQDIMKLLQDLLHIVNPYAQLFHSIKDASPHVQDFKLHFTVDNAFDKRRYNLPANQGEIAAVFTTMDGAPPSNFEFVVYYKYTRGLTNINYLNPHCDPMCYPLLFPCGESGWKPGMAHVDIHRSNVRNTTTQLQYYCHRLAQRDGFSLIHSSGKLFQQYIVDSYVKVEGARIAYVRTHQKELRAETYRGLLDYMANEDDNFQPGIRVILPSTFIGSPRNMIQNYQDAMSIVSKYGKPDIFITFTCNPRWKEITSNLKPFEKVHNRPDLVERVFYGKLKKFLNEILKDHVLGVVTAYIQVIEFQKRGLPHAHMLFILRNTDKLREVEDVDSLVCAEIPDPQANPRLHDIVGKCMIHGPCGAINPQSPCMEDGHCIKGFPKEFVDETSMNVNGYPLYKRRNDGNIMTVKNNIVVDNKWVVPYNPYFSLRYNAHINIEICSSIKSVKYLYKYVYKGHDCSTVHIHSDNNDNHVHDELQQFIDCRYVSPPEAMWRLHERPLYKKSHTIVRLPIHLPEEHLIYFRSNVNLLSTYEKDTKLTAYFKLCSKDILANDLLYSEIPQHYTWKNGVWKPRKREAKSFGRMYTVSPIAKELFSLRLLLLHKRGPKSFEDLRTVNGNTHSTFTEAAQSLNLLQNDEYLYECLQEASTFQMPKQLRQLFGILCIFFSINDALHLWNDFKDSLSEDYAFTPDRYNKSLCDIDIILKGHGKNLQDFGLPPIIEQTSHEIPINFEIEKYKGKMMYEKLNKEQQNIVDEILITLKNTSQCFFIDGPGGTGKTFLYKTLTHILRGQCKHVLSVAWTGIAAVLLEDGRTAHSIFKFPVPLLPDSVSSIRLNSKEAEVIRTASLIIWDEISMVPKDALTVLDILLKDVMESKQIFGGKIIVFGGDFRQILPVVRRGNRTKIVEANVKKSPLWKYITKRKLQQNMRAGENETFSKWLLELGEGILPIIPNISPNSVNIPKKCHRKFEELIIDIFGSHLITDNNIQKFVKTAILCPKNEDCDKINNYIINNMVEGESKTYYSFDYVLNEDPINQQLYPTEFLNSINASGLPPHALVLKKNTIIILIRNLNSRLGIVNGTRLIVHHLTEHTIIAKTLESDHFVIIPQIILSPSDPSIPFILSRKQFPVKVAFAMTINKSQGQTLDKAGIYLPNPVFSHGQLYVAFSRVKSFENVVLAVEETHTQRITNEGIITSNVVYKEVL